MKFIMVIIICFGANCQAIWEQTWYTTIDECLAQSQPARNYMMNTYPESSGQIYCMDEQEFDEYYNFLREGGKPTIDLLPEPTSI